MDEYIYSQSVHKDFHQVMSFLIKFLRENHDKEHTKNFFSKAASYIYKPLIERIRKNGLSEMEKHLKRVFDMEKGKYNLTSKKDKEIIFKVKKCPAIRYLKKTGSEIDKNFCFCSTELVNKAIAKECGYNFSVDYDQENGKCVQKFWKEDK